MAQNREIGELGDRLTVDTSGNSVSISSNLFVTSTVNAASHTTGSTGTGTGGISANATNLWIGNNSVNSSLTSSEVRIGGTLIGNSTGPYGKTEATLNVNSALTSNNSSYLGGTAAASYALKADVHYIGTTSVALNRASASLALTGITSIDGTANNSTYAFGKTEGNLNVNSATYATSSSTNTFTIGTAAYHVANGNFGIGTTTPRAILDVANTSAMIIPTGTTAQRPTGIDGMIRYNTDTVLPEYYSASYAQWIKFKDAPTYTIYYVIVGGGGGGGYGSGNDKGGAGGGAGGMVTGSMTVSSASTYSVDVGGGGGAAA